MTLTVTDCQKLHLQGFSVPFEACTLYMNELVKAGQIAISISLFFDVQVFATCRTSPARSAVIHIIFKMQLLGLIAFAKQCIAWS